MRLSKKKKKTQKTRKKPTSFNFLSFSDQFCLYKEWLRGTSFILKIIAGNPKEKKKK